MMMLASVVIEDVELAIQSQETFQNPDQLMRERDVRRRICQLSTRAVARITTALL